MAEIAAASPGGFWTPVEREHLFPKDFNQKGPGKAPIGLSWVTVSSQSQSWCQESVCFILDRCGSFKTLPGVGAWGQPIETTQIVGSEEAAPEVPISPV